MQAVAHADVIVTTPEKWDGISRSWQTRSYVKAVTLLVIDEIHLLGAVWFHFTLLWLFVNFAINILVLASEGQPDVKDAVFFPSEASGLSKVEILWVFYTPD